MFRNYAEVVGLVSQTSYIYGNPLSLVVPLDVGTEGVVFLGAYPSARFECIGRVTDVAVGDILGPLANERWFDGKRVREQMSTNVFVASFLEPLELDRSACWITSLVFLLKNAHVEKYQRLGATPPIGYKRERFYELGRLTIPTLEKELKLAQPQILITLGREVAGVLREVSSESHQTRLLVPETSDVTIGNTAVRTVHCPLPGILMYSYDGNPWPDRLRNEFIPVLKQALTDGAGQRQRECIPLHKIPIPISAQFSSTVQQLRSHCRVLQCY